MSPLNYGLTPKMKPLSARRSALVVALDIGTSKIACLIARLTPTSQGEALRRRTHSIEVIGFSHTGARGMKAGAVVDLVDAEEAVRHAVDLAERTARSLFGESGWVTMSHPMMGAEDFSYVLQKVPGAMAFLGAAPEGGDYRTCCALHSNRMVLNEDVLARGIAMHCAMAEAALSDSLML